MATGCIKCGTEILPGGRFCRRCGEPFSVTEATTRVLDQPQSPLGSAANYSSVGTGPAYLAPGQPVAPMPATTNKIDASRSSRTAATIITSILLMIAAIGALIFLTMARPSDIPPPAGGPAAGQPPGLPVPPTPPAPPAPPAPPVPGSATSSFDQLIYPGAKITMRMAGGKMITLKTADSAAKVTAWYIAKINPSTIMKGTEAGSGAFLKNATTSVAIGSSDAGTSIFIKQDGSNR